MSVLTSVITAGFDVDQVRQDFPVLKQRIHGKPLVYLDSAATAQKPFAVIDAIRKFTRWIAPTSTAACMS